MSKSRPLLAAMIVATIVNTVLGSIELKQPLLREISASSLLPTAAGIDAATLQFH
jgi:hypothetical protein